MNEQKNSPHTAPPPRSNRDQRRWTLLFVGERGKTITFYHFKGIVMTALAVVIACIAASGWFYHLYRNGLDENKTLGAEIKGLKRTLDSERREKEIITARLVVSESRIEESMAKLKPEQAIVPRPKPPPSKVEEPVKKLLVKPPDPPLNVAAENFIVFYEPDINSLRVEYKVVNTGSKTQPVSGRTVVVMKDDSDNPQKWLVLPRVPIISGKPAGDQGRSFSIRNFRTMRFKANNQIGPDQFKTAIVYIFTATGTLLLEKEYPVGIKSRTLSSASKPEKTARPALGKSQPKSTSSKKPGQDKEATQDESTKPDQGTQITPVVSTDPGQNKGITTDESSDLKQGQASAPAISGSQPEPAEERSTDAMEQLEFEIEMP